jgi:hypothetical protein
MIPDAKTPALFLLNDPGVAQPSLSADRTDSDNLPLLPASLREMGPSPCPTDHLYAHNPFFSSANHRQNYGSSLTDNSCDRKGFADHIEIELPVPACGGD